MEEGLYIYCIIESEEPSSFDIQGIGGRGDKVYTISLDNIGAVVSVSPIKRYSVARENLMAHERVIEEVMKTHTVLPVRFATITESEEKIRMILKREYPRFAGLLKQMADKKELGLKMLFKEDIVYGELLEKYDDVKTLKQKIESLPAEKSYHQRMEIGRMVEAALRREKEFYREYALNRLTPLSVEVKTNKEYGDMMIVNASFLVVKEREREFDLAVQELADKCGDMVRLKYVGTLPPFNFVNIVINMDGGGQCSL